MRAEVADSLKVSEAAFDTDKDGKYASWWWYFKSGKIADCYAQLGQREELQESWVSTHFPRVKIQELATDGHWRISPS